MESPSLDAIELIRGKYKPETGHIRVVFVGESRPDPGRGQFGFFYSSYLSSHDNLFRGLMKGIYDANAEDLTGRKDAWLQRFQHDGFWLLDVVPHPVNHLRRSERNSALRENVDAAAARILTESPSDGIVICHAGTYHTVTRHFRTIGLRVLHSEALPFPLGSHRARFVDGIRKSLNAAGIPVPFQK